MFLCSLTALIFSFGSEISLFNLAGIQFGHSPGCKHEFGVPAKWIREFYPDGKEYYPGGESELSCPKCREQIELK